MRDFIRKINWLKVFAFWGIATAVVQNVWAYFETAEHFKSNHIYFVLGCLIVTVLISFLMAGIEKISKPKTKNEIADYLNDIKETVTKLDKEGQEFELKMIKWRMGVEAAKAKNIQSGVWSLQALQTYEYVRYICGSILNNLVQGDEYITLSNLNFWYKDKYGGTDFMATNIAAAKRGVSIKRIIILDNDILLNPKNYHAEISALKELIPSLNAQIIRNPEAAKHISMYFYLSKNYESDARPPVPYAIITNKDKTRYMAVIPSSIHQGFANPQILLKLKSDQNMMDFDIDLDRFNGILSKSSSELLSLEAMAVKLQAIAPTANEG